MYSCWGEKKSDNKVNCGGSMALWEILPCGKAPVSQLERKVLGRDLRAKNPSLLGNISWVRGGGSVATERK